jgi:hypothetical protein
MNRNELNTKASYLVTYILARKIKPFTKSDVVKESFASVHHNIFNVSNLKTND